MQYIPAACSTSEWPAGGVNPKPPKTSLQAVVDAESRPSIPRWGKRSPPPVAVAAFVPPTPAATSGSLSSLISCPCGTLLAAVPRITWHFYFAFCPAILLPLTELRIGPPSPATPSHHSHPQQHPTRCLSSLEEVVAVQFPFFADASFCQMLPHPDGADQPCHRRVLIVVRCPVSAGTKPFLTPPPPSLIRTPVVGRRLPMVCVCVCVRVLLRGDDAPLPDPTSCPPPSQQRNHLQNMFPFFSWSGS